MFNEDEKNLLDELEAKFDELFDDDYSSMELDSKIILNDEDGKEVEFEFLDLITYKGQKYVVLLPAEESNEAGEFVVLKLEDSENEDEESYVSVDDDDTLMAVLNIFKDKFVDEFKDEFNFVD